MARLTSSGCVMFAERGASAMDTKRVCPPRPAASRSPFSNAIAVSSVASMTSAGHVMLRMLKVTSSRPASELNA